MENDGNRLPNGALIDESSQQINAKCDGHQGDDVTTNIKTIKSDELDNILNILYTEKKDHLKEFIKNSMNELLKDQHPGDIFINNIIIDIFRDDDLCKQTLKTEIELYQKNNLQ